ncbi:unnamed protein product [Polarella glacialis]|uniref:Reverse transcriptase domain-containing protein n=1 Tax=Polarella glacialis TaxID=89957 RepID=A0A813D0S3_POLGL|nr:unnamed protein product [Polarella glacialis]
MAPDISADLVENVMRSFPLDCAAGLSGLRIQHLFDAKTPDQGDSMTEQLAEVVHLLARGLAPRDLAQHLAGAGLMALEKATGGVRRIAIGEILRCITGKCLCSVAKEAAQTFFQLSQVGIACPPGVDAAIHSCRAWPQREHGILNKGMAQPGFGNAFNCIDQNAALQQVRLHFPELAHWAQWCYAEHYDVLFGTHTLRSAAGIQQGDPLGPLIFSAAIQPLTAELKQLSVNNKKLDLTTFYLDDGFFAGDLEVVAAALALVQNRSAEIGLSLNLGKCELMHTATLTEGLPALDPDALLRNPGNNTSKVALAGNFELLGAAIGDRSHCEQYAASKVANSAANALKDFDSALRTTVCSTTGLLLTNNEWAKAGRGFKQAGLGLRSAPLHAEAAYLASACSSRDTCRQLDPDFALDANVAASNFGQSLAAHNSKLPPDRHLAPQAIIGRRQQSLSNTLDMTNYEAQLASAGLADQATLPSECEAGARDFWQVVPHKHLDLAVPAAEFIVELRYRLCMKNANCDRRCPLSDQVLDSRGHHSRRCCAGSDRTRKHNKLRNKVFSFATTAGANPELEKPDLLLPQRPGDLTSTQGRTADIYLPTWTNGSPMALDFTITAPQRSDIIDLAAKEGLAAAQAYSQTKREFLGTEAACAQAAGVAFQPMVAETSGAWSPATLAVLKQLAKAVSVRQCSDHDAVLREMIQRTSMCIRRASAVAHLRRAAADLPITASSTYVELAADGA